MNSGQRLREERERLGFSQNDFAALVPVTRKTMFNWESGAGHVATEALAVWARSGLDVLYVVTGERLPMQHPVPGPRQQALLNLFDAADESGRRAIEAAAAQATGQPSH